MARIRRRILGPDPEGERDPERTRYFEGDEMSEILSLYFNYRNSLKNCQTMIRKAARIKFGLKQTLKGMMKGYIRDKCLIKRSDEALTVHPFIGCLHCSQDENIQSTNSVINAFTHQISSLKQFAAFDTLDRLPFSMTQGECYENNVDQLSRIFIVENAEFNNYSSFNDHDLSSHSFCRYTNGVCRSLPVLGIGKSDAIFRIQPEILSKTMKHSQFIIVDCRFVYEYRGGHIMGSINLNNSSDIDQFFFGKDNEHNGKILIFHCEYSSDRAPKLALYLRNKDREVNQYPCLDYPEIYVLSGGYKDFYARYPEFCDPQFYVSKDDAEYRRISGYESDNLDSVSID